MATLTIRDLPDSVREKLRMRAAGNGRSMEAEVRTLLAASVERPSASSDRKAHWEAAVREAQEVFAPYRHPKVSIVDELIADRRLEAWRETVDEYEWLNRDGDASLRARDPRP